MKRVLLLSGKINSGKNQLAEYLTEGFDKIGLSTRSDLFAKPLKDGCREDFARLATVLQEMTDSLRTFFKASHDNGMTDYQERAILRFDTLLEEFLIRDENWYEQKTPITRAILQIYGTEIFRRRVQDDWWVDKMAERVRENSADVTVVTDARYPNEVDGLKHKLESEPEFEVIAIRIDRDIKSADSVATHSSEIALDDYKGWSYRIDNNGTLDELKAAAQALIENITAGVRESEAA